MLAHDLVELLLVLVERLLDLRAKLLERGAVTDVHDLTGVDRGDEIVQLVVGRIRRDLSGVAGQMVAVPGSPRSWPATV